MNWVVSLDSLGITVEQKAFDSGAAETDKAF